MSEILAAPFDCNHAIRSLVDDAKLKQQVIGDAIGVTQGRVSHFYNGTDKQGMRYESYYRLSKLCEEYGIQTEEANREK